MPTFRPKMAAAFGAIRHSRARHKLIYGGAGSGKSWAAAQHIILRCLAERGHAILVVRKVARTLRGSVFKRILAAAAAMGVSGMMHSTVNPLEIYFPATDSYILFAGVDDPEKLKSIHKVTSIWVEEGTELREEDYEELNRRMRGAAPGLKEIIMTFNPISTYSWIYRRWWVNNLPCFKLHTTYLDNPFLDDEDRHELEIQIHINPAAYQVYTKGEWGTPEGRVYRPFREAPPPDPVTVRETWYGLDFGFTNSYTALLKAELDSYDLIHFTELVYERGLIPSDLATRMDELGINYEDEIWADPSQPGSIVELRRKGFNVRPAINKVTEGINKVIQYRPRLRVADTNINIKRENALYCYKKDKDGHWLNDPVKSHDHAMDAIRYAVMMYARRND